MAVDLFIPHCFLDDRISNASLLFGSTIVDGDHVVVCCVASTDLGSKIFQSGDSSAISFISNFRSVGIIRRSNRTLARAAHEVRGKVCWESTRAWFEISLPTSNSELIDISHLVVDGNRVSSKIARVIIFSAKEFLDASLLIAYGNSCDRTSSSSVQSKFKGTFVDSIVSNLRKVTAMPDELKEQFALSCPMKQNREQRMSNLLKSFFHAILLYICVIIRMCETTVSW